MKFAKWRLYPALRYLRVPGFSQLLPEFQCSIFGGLMTTFLFYHSVESPWYVSLIVLWLTPQLLLGLIMISLAFSSPKKLAC